MKTNEYPKENELDPISMLKGYGIGVAFGVIAFIVSQNMVISLASMVSIGTAVGIALAQKSTNPQYKVDRAIKVAFAGIFLLGVILLVIFLLL